MHKRDIAKALKVCTLNHGGPHNAASVYGHGFPNRACIRIHNTDVWVYDPRWEAPSS